MNDDDEEEITKLSDVEEPATNEEVEESPEQEDEEDEEKHGGDNEEPSTASAASVPETPGTNAVHPTLQHSPMMPQSHNNNNIPIQPYAYPPPYPYPPFPGMQPHPPFPHHGAASQATMATSPSSRSKTGYTDLSLMNDPVPESRRNRGGVTEPFPEKLHRMLDICEREGHGDVVSFFSHGRAFAIHKPRRFQSEIMPRFFRQTRLTSFQRQLNLYGFQRISSGPDHGGYFHELFLKGRPGLCINMKRTKIKGASSKQKNVEFEGEPNFYSMPPVSYGPPPPTALLPPPPPAGASAVHGSSATSMPMPAAAGVPLPGQQTYGGGSAAPQPAPPMFPYPAPPGSYMVVPMTGTAGPGVPPLNPPAVHGQPPLSSNSGGGGDSNTEHQQYQQQAPPPSMYPYPPHSMYGYPAPPWGGGGGMVPPTPQQHQQHQPGSHATSHVSVPASQDTNNAGGMTSSSSLSSPKSEALGPQAV